MGDYAHVESLDALRKFRSVLIKFVEGVGVGLDEAEAEILRTELWLKQEQPGYWKQQLARRTELYTRAKSELNRKKFQSTALGNRPSCVDELKALARAERALDEARQKQADVRRWSRLFEQEHFSYAAVSQTLRTGLQTGLPRALAQLDNMIAALEAYATSPPARRAVSTAARGTSASPPGNVDVGGMSRGGGAEPDLEELVAVARQLRARTRAAAAGAASGLSENAMSLPSGLAATGGCSDAHLATIAEVVKRLGLAGAAPAPNDTVFMSCSAIELRSVYLERLPSATPGDSGWYLGSTAPGTDSSDAGLPGAAIDAIWHIAELSERWPGLAPLLELPAGWLVLLDAARGSAIYDPQDRVIWQAPVAASHVERAAADAAASAGDEESAVR